MIGFIFSEVNSSLEMRRSSSVSILQSWNYQGRKKHAFHVKCLRVESLEVLEILPQGFQEQSELPEFKIVAAVLVAHPREGLVPGKVVCPVDGRLAVEEIVAL